MNMNGFPTRAPVELEERPRQRQWLVDSHISSDPISELY